MASGGYEFRDIDLLEAGAKGTPGSRTFYMLIGDRSILVRLWVRKEHLVMLSEAIQQALAEFPDTADAPVIPNYSGIDDSKVDNEINVGSLALAIDQERRQIGIFVYDRGAQESSPPSYRCWANPNMMKIFTRKIDEVCASGRPTCPLCAQPVEPTGHVCPRSNGHHATLV